MCTWLKVNPDAASKRGLNADFTAEMEKNLEIIKSLDIEQEYLKTKLQTKTTELYAELANAHVLYSNAKKVVKMVCC